MPNNYFKFKQFTINQDKCAMKVGTDGTLLGALAHVTSYGDILDIGSGTGIISLMIAQRISESHITAIEIDSNAAQQSIENVKSSPWCNRIDIINDDFNTHSFGVKFHYIVSNPPFYQETLFCPDPLRDKARHTQSLPFEQLLKRVSELLTEDGVFSVILPNTAISTFENTAFIYGLYPTKIIRIQTKTSKQFKRGILYLTKTNNQSVESRTLTILDNDGAYSAEYVDIMREFYLNF